MFSPASQVSDATKQRPKAEFCFGKISTLFSSFPYVK